VQTGRFSRSLDRGTSASRSRGLQILHGELDEALDLVEAEALPGERPQRLPGDLVIVDLPVLAVAPLESFDELVGRGFLEREDLQRVPEAGLRRLDYGRWSMNWSRDRAVSVGSCRVLSGSLRVCRRGSPWRQVLHCLVHPHAFLL
jgi:hypothetical protein